MENQQIEYKKSFGKDVIVSLVAFANSEGGKVMVGVLDNGGHREPQVTPQVTPQVNPQVSLEVLRLLRTLDRPLSRQEIQSKLGLQDRKHLRQKYLLPALEAGLIELAEPDKPNSPRQKYLLSHNGRMLLEEAS